MMKSGTVSALLAAVFLCGCTVTTPQAPIRPAVKVLRRAETREQQKRMNEIRTLLAPFPVRGIGLYHRAFSSGYDHQEICRFLRNCGFNRAYFHISSESELDDELSAFLTAASAAGLEVEIVLRQRDFYRRYRGNRLLQKIKDHYPDLKEAVERVIQFNDLQPENGKIRGITALVEPHYFTIDRIDGGQIFAWNDKAFGPGSDNDMLVRNTLDMLKKIDTGKIPLTVGVPDFCHDFAEQGKLSCGKIQDFAAAVKDPDPALILMSTGNKAGDVIRQAEKEYAAMKKGRLILGVALSDHTAISANSLRRRDWNDLMRIFRYVIKESRSCKAFSGVMISPLAVFENIIMEQD